MTTTPARPVSRRSVLKLSLATAAVAPVLSAGPALAGGARSPLAPRAGAPAPTGPILKPLPPDRFVVHGTNAEMRWGSVRAREALTSQADLFVRNHTRTPVIEPATYALRVHGDGLARGRGADEGLSFRLADLKRLPRTTITATHECTGNGRRFFAEQQGTPASGTPWALGAVGAVRWEGVLLRDLLHRIGIRRDAVSVMATGLDDPYVSGGVDYGRVRRPFGIDKALDDALLAWSANGEPLLPDHGFPLRLVLPGWVGIASIKWLGSLEVSTTEQTSPWNTLWYRMTGGDHPADAAPLSLNPVRSAFELDWDEVLPAARTITLTGRSWSGAAPIVRVEVSVDGGSTWRAAGLRDKPRCGAGHGAGHGRTRDLSWTRWSYQWRRPAAGAHELLARATDAAGRTQPLTAAYNDGGYLFDAVVRHPVTVV
ncbi:molybdopterin-dependent oxidoreductase [Nocardioides sp. dk4132]|uniref:molybdopterin-dependent oxidoreductase n=1 Tax=unclassified Nocardioides TaxID=2615069 RepID=UPI001296DC57|nr:MULTISPECIES: molybdopterin-dependent oxidoreductase [unclassified Nocardioides]MQW76573.1 molybdopterin-dependent oxidoreductase [Nocardioides sp. dk4132]QGA07172.1 molybdopterin-dependent oxidoreductase [Nocardioides sp. dk884]